MTSLPEVEYAMRWELSTVLTSCLVKYFRHPSRSDKRNLRGRNCPLSRPRFQRMPSFTPRNRKVGFKSIPPQASELYSARGPSHTLGQSMRGFPPPSLVPTTASFSVRAASPVNTTALAHADSWRGTRTLPICLCRPLGSYSLCHNAASDISEATAVAEGGGTQQDRHSLLQNSGSASTANASEQCQLVIKHLEASYDTANLHCPQFKLSPSHAL